MIMQNVRLPDWDWDVLVFYDVGPEDADAVLFVLDMIGASDDNLERAEINLRKGFPNNGLTYTNGEDHSTVMVIGRASCPEQYWNTISHESGHAVSHIAEKLGLDDQGEEYHYLAGALCQKLYPAAKTFICGCN